MYILVFLTLRKKSGYFGIIEEKWIFWYNLPKYPLSKKWIKWYTKKKWIFWCLPVEVSGFVARNKGRIKDHIASVPGDVDSI